MRPRLLELAVFTTSATALAAFAYGPNVVHGGFLLDAWVIRAGYVFAPQGDLLHVYGRFLEYPALIGRPLQAILFATMNLPFGSHMSLWLASVVALGVLISAALFLLLRELGLERLHAGVISALVLVFPAATSLRLWSATVAAQLTVALVIAGFLLALRAFEAAGRRRLALHAVSLTLFVASLLLYESALPLMLASVLLYRLRVPWTAAVRRWAIDCAVLIPLVVLVTRSSSVNRTSRGLGSTLEHAGAMLADAKALALTVIVPFGGNSWYMLLAIALIPATAAIVSARLEPGSRLRLELRRWLALTLAGLVVVALGYAVFAGGHDYYTPSAPGIGDRINAAPSIGWVLALYGVIMLAATLACRGLAHARALRAAVAILACLALGASWARTAHRDADTYAHAYIEGERLLDTIATAVPAPPAGSVIWAFGQPLEAAVDVPIFVYAWDLTAALKLRYGDPTIAGRIGYAKTVFECRAEAIGLAGNPAFGAAYGRAYFVDTISGRGQRIDTPAQCRRAARLLPRSPNPPVKGSETDRI